MLPVQGARVRSLAGELDPACMPQLGVHMPQGRSRTLQLQIQRTQINIEKNVLVGLSQKEGLRKQLKEVTLATEETK